MVNKRQNISPSHNHGFTIVELLIVIVVIAILAAISVATYNGISVRARNTAMVTGVKQYISAIDAYQVFNDHYPEPPTGTSLHDHQACFGNNYIDNACMAEDDGPGVINPQPWFTADIETVTSNAPTLPSFVKWNSSGNDLYAGAFYISTKNYNHPYLAAAGLQSADALVVFYLEGNVPDMCKIHEGIPDVYLVGMSTDKDITICYIPFGEYVEQ